MSDLDLAAYLMPRFAAGAEANQPLWHPGDREGGFLDEGADARLFGSFFAGGLCSELRLLLPLHNVRPRNFSLRDPKLGNSAIQVQCPRLIRASVSQTHKQKQTPLATGTRTLPST